MSHWGYTKEDGPDTWPAIAPAGKGVRQSPIDIYPKESKYDAGLAAKPLKVDYSSVKAKNLENNGHSAQVNYGSTEKNLEGGPVAHKYALQQFHLHWGKTANSGSEHRVEGKMYASELHLVHWNIDLFKKFGEAAEKDNGLCVLGIFLEESSEEHAGFKQMTDLLSQIPYGGDKVDLPSGLDPAKLLPGDITKYWTYLGSLTTPPLFESVTWIVFKEPIKVSSAQMDKLRSLNQQMKGQTLENEFHGHIVENYRPPQALNKRVVRASFQ